MPVDRFYQPPRRWTLGEVLALPEDSANRIELIDGELVVSPAPTRRHQHVQNMLQFAFTLAVPNHLQVLPGINVVLSETRKLIPDIAIATASEFDSLFVQPDEVVLVVEIISPSSRGYDRVRKRAVYAEAAGIEYYLVVDPSVSPVQTDVLGLSEGAYELVGERRSGTFTLTDPFPVEIKLG